jgi:cytochrome c
MHVSKGREPAALLIAGAFLAAAAPAAAAFSYPGCADLAPSDFAVETLAANATDPTVQEPMKMAFDMDGSGNVAVFFTQRQGLLRKYDPVAKKLVNLADFSKYPNFTTKFSGGSDGLLGIALDPAFKSNHWVYLYISTGTTGTGDWRVSRFTLNGDALDMASEKVLLKIPQASNSQHPGGALAFDGDGNLWITVGDNHKEWPAANTNDLRGKILRIHPKDDGTYSIPAGNLFPADKYPADKTRPEIYIMGNRNPYTITLDAVRHAVTWGDVGPDAGLLTEERDFATKPMNGGWPFWSGDQVSQGKGSGTPDKPINNDASNTGLTELPPAIPGFDNYKQSCAVTGPVYYYDGANASKVKMPPHLNGMWFVSDFSHFAVEALTLDAAGSKILSRQPIFADIKLDRVLDFQTGPDGAFYFVNYAGYRDWTSKTGIVRIVYKGNCSPAVALAPQAAAGPQAFAVLSQGTLQVTAPGAHALEIKDLAGRVLLSRRGEGPVAYSLSGLRGKGLCIATVATALGAASFKLVR